METTSRQPRPEKVALVSEISAALREAQAVLLTEYRGLSVSQLAELREQLAGVGGQYRIFKNTLVRRAAASAGIEGLDPLLQGPTAIALTSGDAAQVAKAIRDFSRAHPALALKGGLLSGEALSAAQALALADLPSREVLLAQVAGALAAPMAQLAALMAAVPRSLAFGIKALIDQRAAAAPEVA